MGDAYREGYFPPDLSLGLETGWTLKEIKELDPLTKRMYLEFLRLKQENEQEKMDAMKKDIENRTSPQSKEQVITFIDEEEFVSKVGGVNP